MTITAKTARTRLSAMKQILSKLEHDLPPAVAGVHSKINEHDGFGSKGESAGRGSSSSSSVEASMMAIGPHVEKLQDLEDILATIGLSLGLATTWASGQTPPVEVTHSRCSGGRSIDAWSRPDCENWVDYRITDEGRVAERGDGLCQACRKRRDRAEAKALAAALEADDVPDVPDPVPAGS